jgi:hypothetical protein
MERRANLNARRYRIDNLSNPQLERLRPLYCNLEARDSAFCPSQFCLDDCNAAQWRDG